MVLACEFILVFDGQSLKDHFILCECSSLISQQVFDSAQFFRNITVSGNCSLNITIIVDFGRIDELSKVHVDSK